MDKQFLKNKLTQTSNDLERAIQALNLLVKDMKEFDLSVKFRLIESDIKKLMNEIKKRTS